MALRAHHNLGRPLIAPVNSIKTTSRKCNLVVRNCTLDPAKSRKQKLVKKHRNVFKVETNQCQKELNRMLVLEVKEKLEKEYPNLPVGKNGRDDEDMIFWFLKDRKFSVEGAISKLTKAIKWRQDFRVSELTEESVKIVAKTGKSYVHDFLDVYNRPVLVVVPSKHFPYMHDRRENEKLCVFLIEKALAKLPAGQNQILGLFDLRGFSTENADLKFLTFVFDVFYYYYPSRLGEALFVDAPFLFKPFWQLAKPLIGSYASLVRFCSVDTVRKEYFTEKTAPPSFRG